MYYCQMPDCDYVCEAKSLINFHHIVPVSMGGSNKNSNLIELCPNCHARIYVDGIKSGSHAIIHENSVIFLGKLLSTGGYVISYTNINTDEVKYHFLK